MSERERQLSQIAQSPVGTGLQWNEELARRIILAEFALYKEKVLPLQEASQRDISANGVDSDVDACPCSKIIVGELADHRIGLLHAVLIKETHIASVLDRTKVDGTHEGIAQKRTAGIPGNLNVEVERHLALSYQDSIVLNAVLRAVKMAPPAVVVALPDALRGPESATPRAPLMSTGKPLAVDAS
jgi:hypothetical protein